MSYQARWQTITEIGRGGQGVVYRVLDKDAVQLDANKIKNAFASASAMAQPDDVLSGIQDAFRLLIRADDPSSHGALKVLNLGTSARNRAHAEERIHREIEAMQRASHPALLRVLDADPAAGWFVSKFYHAGTLDSVMANFTGNVPRTLQSVRPLIAGVASLHGANLVHRDIKPQNVFVDSPGRLVLGDFGLVYFGDDKRTRVSDTFENVGSTDWMPGWAMRMRVDEVGPQFDVFSLGKLIWAMLAKKKLLRLWYFRDEEFDLCRMFPSQPHMKLVNQLLSKCIVERQADCLPNASALLEEVETLQHRIAYGANMVDDGTRPCLVCGTGQYTLIANRGSVEIDSFGLHPSGARSYKIFTCHRCGHVQLFACEFDADPPGWGS